MKKLNMNKSVLSTLGLILITVWSAVQYLFYSNVPEDISSFAFVFITNVCGCLLLALTQFSHLKNVTKATVKKAILLSVIQLMINVMILLGSRNMNSVIISSVTGLYFIFVTPLLLLLKKRVSFRSGVATVVALIALLLVFNANIEGLFSSINVVYLLIADVCIAGHVVAISIMAADEDPQAISVVQMASTALISLIAWVVESKVLGLSAMKLSPDPAFWVSVLFIGIFIRALYSVIQFAAQKNVPPINASLIFASEIVITLILNPLLCRLFGTGYEPATLFQVVGCVLFVLAVLICDDDFMKKFHYNDMDSTTIIDENGNEIQQVPLSRKIVNMNLLIGLGALVFSTLVCLFSITVIRNNVIDTSRAFGNDASTSSETALMEQVEKELEQKVADKAAVATERLDSYRSAVQNAASLAGQFLSDPSSYKRMPVGFPHVKNAGIWTMQMTLADEAVSQETIETQSCALGNMETLFVSIQQSFPELTTVYVGTDAGVMISYDPGSDGAGVYGTPFYYEYRGADWFTTADKLKAVGFTDTYLDYTGRGLTITCFSPIYSSTGKFLGAIGMDFLQTDLNKQLVDVGISAPEKAVLVSAEGTIIASTGDDSVSESTLSIKDSAANLPLEGIADWILSTDSGMTLTEDPLGSYYVSFDKVESTGWKLCIMSPLENIIAPAVEIRDNITNSTEQISYTVSEGIRTIIASCLIFFAVIVLLITYFVGRLSDKITEPLSHLEKDVKEISQGNLDRRTEVTTRDEIGSLARAFNSMTANLQQYIVDLTEMTAQEERIASELSVATRIQSSMLPDAVGAFPDRSEFELFAAMTPAKEVGGDFYDFFMVDERHLAVVMADVSGKGVPAALFMVIGKTLIKDHTHPDANLGEVFERVNNLLCESNSEELFITAFEGVIDLVTGEVSFVNAGHEMPFIYRKDKAFEVQRVRPGFVLAGMEDMHYRSGSFTLQSGDILFQYTDGVPEATNAENELFGMDRLTESLNKAIGSSPEGIIKAVKADVDAFVGEAPQFDDITMLAVKINKLMEP